jgi:ABC-type multidrug transport system fused ATPase/permease subunit
MGERVKNVIEFVASNVILYILTTVLIPFISSFVTYQLVQKNILLAFLMFFVLLSIILGVMVFFYKRKLPKCYKTKKEKERHLFLKDFNKTLQANIKKNQSVYFYALTTHSVLYDRDESSDESNKLKRAIIDTIGSKDFNEIRQNKFFVSMLDKTQCDKNGLHKRHEYLAKESEETIEDRKNEYVKHYDYVKEKIYEQKVNIKEDKLFIRKKYIPFEFYLIGNIIFFKILINENKSGDCMLIKQKINKDLVENIKNSWDWLVKD